MRRVTVLLLATLLVASCGVPVPPEKAAYVGEWQGPQMSLLITQDGRIDYKRVRGSNTTTLNAPLKGFAGDDFIVGVGPVETVFKVSSAPRQVDTAWVMTVDGVEVRRVR